MFIIFINNSFLRHKHNFCSNPVVACKTLDDTHLGPWKGAPAGDLSQKSSGQYNHYPPPRPPPKFHYKPMYKSAAAAASA